MGNAIDLTGQKFGMLTVLARKLNVSYKALWWYANANGLGAAIKHYKKALNTP
jgi:hypothetical protein